MTEQTPVDRLYDALARGDTAGARACCTPDARFWHCFDGEAQDLDTAVRGWEQLIAHSAARGIEDVRRRPLDDGFVQQHMFAMTTAAGARKGWAVCLVVRLDGDLIARVDEYMDRAGSFAPAEGAPTPGL